jgi:Concanavalin A-like lectin/glucanases superfamily
MNYKNNMITRFSLIFVIMSIGLFACQKMSRPALGDYPKDSNPPGGPLKFYAAFDGTSSSPLMNAVDGISGKAVQGDGTAFIKYAGANDFISLAKSFTVSFWEKRDGSPANNSSFVFHFASSNGYWTGGSAMFLLFDWAAVNTPDSAALKLDVIDKNVNDNWFQWIGSDAVKGIQDNQWHHLAFVYDETTSVMTLYVDGVADAVTQSWPGHGPANMDASKITDFDIAGNSQIPNMGWGQDWDGGLDQFRLYAEALSASDIQALYNGKQ